MFSSENPAGRLVELRIVTPVSVAEIAELQKRHATVTRSVSGQYVVAVDLRRAHVFPPAISEGFIALMTQLNPRLERSALVINESAVLGLQAERAIETAGNPDRRSFREPRSAIRWLSEVLDASESRRLEAFFAEGEVDSTPAGRDEP